MYPTSTSSSPAIGVVIPAYAEWHSILQTLAGFARSADQTGAEISTVLSVVVNAPSTASTIVQESNAQTLRLLTSLQQGDIPSDLTDSMPKFTLKNQVADLFPSAYLSELLAAKQIVEILGRNPGVSLDIVDLHTNPLPRCNIGIARNAGVGYLLSRYPNLQQIVMADGDTQPTPYHGQIVRENILRPLFHGPRLSLCPAPFEETLKIINRNYYVFEMFRHFREAVVMKDASVYHESDFVQGKVTLQRATTANTANMSNESVEWAHMVFSPELFRKVGGFKEVSGGEDTEFGIAAARSGYEHHFLDDFSVATIERFSDRTTTGQWSGNTFFAQDIQNISVMPMDIVMKLSDILRYIFENTGKTLSENFLKEQLIIRAPGLKNFQENDWKTLYAIVSHESVIQFNSAIGTAVVSFLGTSSHTVSLSNAVRMFDRQAQEELVRLALVSEWTRFKTELQSIGVNC